MVSRSSGLQHGHGRGEQRKRLHPTFNCCRPTLQNGARAAASTERANYATHSRLHTAAARGGVQQHSFAARTARLARISVWLLSRLPLGSIQVAVHTAVLKPAALKEAKSRAVNLHAASHIV
jgi:hypothetical protein